MPDLARVFEIPPEKPEVKKESQEKKGAEVLPFTRGEEKKSAKENTFATYQALGGCLSPEDYTTAVALSKAGMDIDFTYAKYAHMYARPAEVELSGSVVRLYALFRDHKRPGVPAALATMGDKKLLAEVLRMEGNDIDANRIIARLENPTFGEKI